MPKLTIGGAEHEVSDALAPVLQAVLAERDDLLTKSKSALETLAAQKTDAEARAKAQEDAKIKTQIEAAAKAGEFDKAQKLANERVERLSERYRDDKLADLVRSHPKLRKDGDEATRKALIDDVVNALKPNAKFDLETGLLTVSDAPAATHLETFLAARPHLRAADLKGGSGAGGGTGGGAGSAPTMTTEQVTDLAATDPKAVASFFAAGGKQVA